MAMTGATEAATVEMVMVVSVVGQPNRIQQQVGGMVSGDPCIPQPKNKPVSVIKIQKKKKAKEKPGDATWEAHPTSPEHHLAVPISQEEGGNKYSLNILLAEGQGTHQLGNRGCMWNWLSIGLLQMFSGSWF